jgi:hypothetical protein
VGRRQRAASAVHAGAEHSACLRNRHAGRRAGRSGADDHARAISNLRAERHALARTATGGIGYAERQRDLYALT